MSRGALPGERRGGRSRGTPNRRTQEQIEAIEQSGITPLAYMLAVLRDEKQPEGIRLDAASRAAPYVHPKLSSTTLDVDFHGRRSVVEYSDEELMAMLTALTATAEDEDAPEGANHG